MTHHFEFDVRVRETGQPYLHFPFMSMSDIHLGAEAQAERVTRWLTHTECDHFKLVGDIVDGEYLEQLRDWQFAAPHRQTLAQLLRTANGRAHTVFVPGNHDALAGRLDGKVFCGMEVKTEDDYIDPTGRRMRIRHGHEFDDAGFTSAARKRFWYRVGDGFNMGFRACDKVIHSALPQLREDFSTAAWMKKVFQPLIDYVRGTSPLIREYINRSPADGLIYGHSHEARFERTHFGKLIINDGCSTDHVQALVHDQHGTWAILTINGAGLYIETEPHGMLPKKPQPDYVSWQSLGLKGVMTEPVNPPEDEFSVMADRVLRIICRAYPPAGRRQLREAIRQNTQLLDQFGEAGRETTLAALAQQQAEYLPLPIAHPRHG